MLQESTNLPTKVRRENGHFTIKDGRVIVNYATGQSSVLIKEIASISWRHKFAKEPNWNYFTISLIILFIGSFLPENGNNFTIFLLLIFVGAMLVGLTMQALKYEWDDVIIETKDGLLIIYSVESGKGLKEVHMIETQKNILLLSMNYKIGAINTSNVPSNSKKNY